ncbi:MAG: class I SAM-dependent methyltransferase [Planctomycetota bacterium]
MSEATPQPLFTLDAMQFFGRVADDYEAMFGVRVRDLQGLRVLDCPSGPGSFVAEANARGAQVIGVDPLYEQPLETLVDRGSSDVAYTIARMQANAAQFADIDLHAYAASKLRALVRFARHFEAGKSRGLYVAAKLPNLPFPDRHFDLALSAHLLFTYSDPASGGLLPDSPFTLDWHLAAVRELLRVTRGEVRLYPTTTRWTTPCRHPYAEAIERDCTARGMRVRYEPSTFARGNHAADTLNASLVIQP